MVNSSQLKSNFLSILKFFKCRYAEKKELEKLLQSPSFMVNIRTIGLGYRYFFWKHLSEHCIEWRFRKNEGMSSSSKGGELAQLFSKLSHKHIYHNQKIDLQTITNISSSKSDLLAMSSLDELVIVDSQDLIPEMTEKQLNKNLSHFDSKIFHCSNETVTCDLWTGEFTWHNECGSHHFCAARYIARHLEKQVLLTVNLEVNAIDEFVYNELFEKYDIFIISTSDSEKNNLLNETLFNLRATFISIPLDFDYFSVDKTLRKSKLIAFYKDDVRVRDIVDIFKRYKMLNCSEYFSTLLKQQRSNVEKSIYFIL